MARTARTRARPATGWTAIEAGIVERLRTEPAARSMAAMLVLAVLALYLPALGYPLVFGDFAFLTPGRLAAYAHAAPEVGGNWLADASFGWSASVFGSRWPWHRALNLVLHAAAVIAAFGLFRRIVAAACPRSPVASGWIAFAAAALAALHPVAVYGVAYLSARYALLLGLLALVALWSTARSLQESARSGGHTKLPSPFGRGAGGEGRDATAESSETSRDARIVASLQSGGRLAWTIGPAAVAAALACSPGALGIPLAMAVVALAVPAAGAAERRRAWLGVAVAGAIAVGFAAAWIAMSPPPEAAASGYTDGYLGALAASCSRWLRYLGFWLVPWTARMAIDMPEPAVAAIWPGWLGIAAVVALALALAWIVHTRRSGLLRAAAIACACALALGSVELFWPRLAAPFALARSYAWMPCLALVPACLVASLPGRAGWALGCGLILAWLVAAADTLQTFSSHVALWDDAVRRVERSGPRAEDARVYLNRATVHRHDGHTLAALADYDKALALQPDMTRALRGRAQVYVDEKRYGEALRDLDRLLDLEPGQAITHADRGLALMQAGRLDEAGKAFDRAIERGVKEPRVFLNRGLARLQLGGLGAAPAALADIERALQLDPDYALAYYNRAMIFEQSANAGIRLRDASSPELMRAVAEQNLDRACQLGHSGACERLRAKSRETLPGADEGPLRVTPEALRQQGLPGR